TIDAPYVACWIGACWAGLAMLRRLESETSAMAPAIALGMFLGVGFLFKYTILLLLPSLLIALIARRRHLRCAKRTAGTLLVATLVLVGCATPVIVWNVREGWPTVAHLLGHLGAPGGDVPTDGPSRAWTPLWFLEFVGTQLAIAGLFLPLMWIGARTTPPGVARTWLVSAALPIVAMYTAVSLFTDAEANWPIAGYASLLCLGAIGLPAGLDAWRGRVRAWQVLDEPRPRAGVLRRRPEGGWQVGRDLALGAGITVAVVLCALPIVTRFVTLERLSVSERLGDAAMDAIGRTGVEPAGLVIVADRYTSASRLAYELHMRLGDDAPLVTSAASLTGDRKSSYDYWPETDPRTIRPGPVLFMGGARERKWTRRFDTGTMLPMLDEPDPGFGGLYFAPGFRALRDEPLPREPR
ncbi:MAG: glycosyltransferase family 39 protein, partial [Planctomycetota bacterium]